MELKKKLYLSPFGRIISIIQNAISIFSRPFMVYGYYSKCDGKFKKHTRISSSAIILNKKNLQIGDNVWIWHYSIIDANTLDSKGMITVKKVRYYAPITVIYDKNIIIVYYVGNGQIYLERYDFMGHLLINKDLE